MYTVIDIETDGLEINSNINLVGIHTFKDEEDDGVYEIFELPKQTTECIDRLHKVVKFVGHNAKFDAKLIHYNLGVDLKIQHDTMYLCYICSGVHDMIYKRGKWFSLKDAAKRELGVKDWDISLKEKKTGSANTKEYLKKDLLYTRKLFEKFKSLAAEEDTGVYNLMIKAANVYKDIELEGIPIDINELTKIYTEYTFENNELDLQLKKFADINYNSPIQLRELLFNDLGLYSKKKTTKGFASTGVEALTELKGQHPIIDILLEKRNTEKALTFLKDWKERAIEGRLYGTFNLHTTVTGRTSSNSPNVQQVPRNKKLKGLFKSKAGWKFVQADYSQMELRIAATVAAITSMIESYKRGEDLHTNMARVITGKEDISKPERTSAKAANFGYLYGMIAKTFVEYAKVGYGVEMSLIEAKRIRNAFFSTNSELLPYYKEVERELVSKGYITSIFGRRYKVGFNHLYIPSDRRDYVRKGINFTVQSSASDYAIMALIEIHHKYKNNDDIKIIGTVHDSVLFEIKDNDKMKEYLKEIKQIMERPLLLKKYLSIGNKLENIPVPIVVDLEVGPWGNGEEVTI